MASRRVTSASMSAWLNGTPGRERSSGSSSSLRGHTAAAANAGAAAGSAASAADASEGRPSISIWVAAGAGKGGGGDVHGRAAPQRLLAGTGGHSAPADRWALDGRPRRRMPAARPPPRGRTPRGRPGGLSPGGCATRAAAWRPPQGRSAAPAAPCTAPRPLRPAAPGAPAPAPTWGHQRRRGPHEAHGAVALVAAAPQGTAWGNPYEIYIEDTSHMKVAFGAV